MVQPPMDGLQLWKLELTKDLSLYALCLFGRKHGSIGEGTKASGGARINS